MPHKGQRVSSATKRRHAATAQCEAATVIESQAILVELLEKLDPYVREGDIELNTGQKVSIGKGGTIHTRLHCGEHETSCEHIVSVGKIGFCKKEAELQNLLVQLEGKRSNTKELYPALSIPATTAENAVDNAMSPANGTPASQYGIDHIKDAIQKLNADQKASLLSLFAEEEFGVFLERTDELEKIQSIQYKFTRRTNDLKAKHRHKVPKRPVIEQRKVGDYLYKRQAGPKGGIYWYMQFTKEGKRQHIYLGKESPSFKPATDLARKQK